MPPSPMRAAALLGAMTLVACAPSLDDEERSAGTATVFDTSRNAFGHPAPDVDSMRRQEFLVGNSFFTDAWVTAPGSVDSRDGLGPVFNSAACAGCHARDGRGSVPDDGDELESALVRISVPGEDAQGGPAPVPGYGGQIQPHGIAGVPGEATVRVRWEDVPGTFDDGTAYTLHRPTIEITDEAFGALPADTLFSLRTAPATFGLGLLECVPEAQILEREDPDDLDGDGVRGRANRPFDVALGAPALGRFGWKANQPSLSQQDRGAFLGDMGLTSDLFPDAECAEGQTECAMATSGGDPEVSAQIADRVDFYVRLLAPPARRDIGASEVQRGRDLFFAFGCETCHRATMTTATCDGLPELSDQRIHAFTDLLLHDMGEELGDGRPDFLATGREWRTPPLWGLGLTEVVSGHERMLHDGRARGASEAILWHGGEAEAAREAYRTAPADDRAALIAFLRSL
ncbi:MAG: di-heme oxidoredictase family protein [Sandaracinaceae bacterium]